VRSIERELAMIMVRGKGENRVEAMDLAEAFRAKVINATTESFIFELTARRGKSTISSSSCDRSGWSKSRAPASPRPRAGPSRFRG
jgi:acetolactate synthase small subunit